MRVSPPMRTRACCLVEERSSTGGADHRNSYGLAQKAGIRVPSRPKRLKKGHLQAILTGRDWGRGVDTKISGRAEELLQRVKTLLGIGSCS